MESNETTTTEIIEEDWSSFMMDKHSDEDDTNANYLTGFAQHNDIIIPLSSATSINSDPEISTSSIISSSYITNMCIPTMKLYCVESLTPLDMINLYNGDHDSTGHRVWMGALFFIECFVCPLLPLSKNIGHDSSSPSSQNDKNTMNFIERILYWRKTLVHNKKILELGCGTGASGLSIIIAGLGKDNTINENEYNHIKPSSVILTDSDERVLDLCKRNLQRNACHLDDDYVNNCHISQLKWGIEGEDDILPGKNSATTNTGSSTRLTQHSQDTIFATDVVYDISAIKPLFETASNLIKMHGYFVLSHIPRASIEEEGKEHHHQQQKDDDEIRSMGEVNTHSCRDRLESLIVEIGVQFGFEILRWNDSNGRVQDCCIRPMDFIRIRKDMITSSKLTFEEMDDVGAAILIFQFVKNKNHRQ
mmetsp:Transcript_10458/g.12138  ORF Transcript_10458/g.12138 Transcript_10458/m.12138 type:complete len:420 (+) Transcript_10458:87-1346(+)